MNLLHLHYFYVVAKENGYTNASKVLRIQQPAISRMVKQLEDSLGFPLFERIGRRIKLTREGQEIFERSRRIFAEVDSLKMSVSELAGIAKGDLAIGASEPIASHLLPETLAQLMPDFPELYPIVYSGTAATLFERIGKGQLEFGLFFHIPQVSENLQVTRLRKIRFYLVVRKDLRKNAKTLSSFIGSREIDDTATRSFPTLEKLRKLHPQATIKISSNNLTSHRQLVLGGLGVAVLPDFLIQADLNEGHVADVLPRERLEFDLKLVTRKNSVPSLNARTFMGYFDNFKSTLA